MYIIRIVKEHDPAVDAETAAAREILFRGFSTLAYQNGERVFDIEHDGKGAFATLSFTTDLLRATIPTPLCAYIESQYPRRNPKITEITVLYARGKEIDPVTQALVDGPSYRFTVAVTVHIEPTAVEKHYNLPEGMVFFPDSEQLLAARLNMFPSLSPIQATIQEFKPSDMINKRKIGTAETKLRPLDPKAVAAIGNILPNIGSNFIQPSRAFNLVSAD